MELQPVQGFLRSSKPYFNFVRLSVGLREILVRTECAWGQQIDGLAETNVFYVQFKIEGILSESYWRLLCKGCELVRWHAGLLVCYCSLACWMVCSLDCSFACLLVSFLACQMALQHCLKDSDTVFEMEHSVWLRLPGGLLRAWAASTLAKTLSSTAADCLTPKSFETYHWTANVFGIS